MPTICVIECDSISELICILKLPENFALIELEALHEALLREFWKDNV